MVASDLCTARTLALRYREVQRSSGGYARISGTEKKTFSVNSMMQSKYSGLRLIGRPTKIRPDTNATMRTSLLWMSISVQSVKRRLVNHISQSGRPESYRRKVGTILGRSTRLHRVYHPSGYLQSFSHIKDAAAWFSLPRVFVSSFLTLFTTVEILPPTAVVVNRLCSDRNRCTIISYRTAQPRLPIYLINLIV